MSVGEYCNRDVVVVEKTESVRTAVDLMRQHHVGDVVVVDQAGKGARPVGILTDRDIVIELLAEDVALDAVNIGDVMSANPVVVDQAVPLLDALGLMQSKGVRRLPVVDASGLLAGLLTVDDVIELLAEQMNALVGVFANEQDREKKQRNR